jgi:hypothetical protein
MAMQVWEVGEYMLANVVLQMVHGCYPEHHKEFLMVFGVATVYQICGNTFANMYPPASHT